MRLLSNRGQQVFSQNKDVNKKSSGPSTMFVVVAGLAGHIAVVLSRSLRRNVFLTEYVLFFSFQLLLSALKTKIRLQGTFEENIISGTPV